MLIQEPEPLTIKVPGKGKGRRIPLKILSYKEEGKCVCHALELDLVGTGDDYAAAAKDLKRAIETQFECAVEEGVAVQFSAPARLFLLYDRLVEELLRGETNSSNTEEDFYPVSWTLEFAETR